MKTLIATDGSADAHAAMAFVKRLGLPASSEVTLLNVVQPISGYAHGESERQAIRDIAASFRAEAEARLANEAALLQDQQWRLNTSVREGHLSDEIITAAEQGNVDLIVMGARGLSRVRRMLLGGVSQQVVKYAPCSVLIVRTNAAGDEDAGTPSAEPRPLRVLLAFDDSEQSRRALELLSSLSLDPRAEIKALTVMPTSTAYRMDVEERLSASWQEEKRHSQAALDAAVERLRHVTPNVESILQTSGDVSEQILEMAGKHHSDLIIVGDKGKTSVKRFLLGSVSHRIVQYAKCPVLVVR